MTEELGHELRVALSLVRRGAALAQAYQRGGSETLRVRHKPRGGGPVTAADEAIDTLVVGALREAFPQDVIIAEESHAAGVEPGGSERCWFVDPIDGTREFALGTPGWTVQLGLCIAGNPVLGVVAEPGEGRLSWAMAEGFGESSARWMGETQVCGAAPGPLAVARRSWDELRLIGGELSAHSRQRAIRQALEVTDARARTVGSVGVRMSAVARGVADLYVQAPGKTKLWDTCGPQALVLAAGGCVSDLRGAPLRFSGPGLSHPLGVVACAPELHAGVLERLRHLVDDWLDRGDND